MVLLRAIGSSWIFLKFDNISWWLFREEKLKFPTLYYKISIVNAACVKKRTCIKYKHSMRRIVETDCLRPQSISRLVLLMASLDILRDSFYKPPCSHTDTGVLFSAYSRCESIKYELKLHQWKIFVSLDRSMKFKKVVNVVKYQNLPKFQSYSIIS